MKNNIKKFLICAFVSVTCVVSHTGRLEMNQPKEVVAEAENDLTTWGNIDNTAGTLANTKEETDVVDNEDAVVLSAALTYTDGWTSTSVNVRKEPNTESEILEVYGINTYVSHHAFEDGWSIIEYNGDYAYIRSDYISDKKVEVKVKEYPKKEYTDESYNEDELYMLSHLIMGESGGQSDTCQLYVGSVILNRMKDSRFPSTMKGVIFQSGQYACTWDGNYYKTPTERCINNAKYLLEHGSVLPENVVWQARRAQGKGVYAIVDGEYFCY